MKSNVKIDKHEPCTITFKTFKNALESQAFSIFLSAFVFGASWIVATSYKELHLTSSDMWVFAIICLFSLIVFLISITRFKKTLNHLIEFATEISKPTLISPFQSLNDEMADYFADDDMKEFTKVFDEGFPSGCKADIHQVSGFDEKVVSEFNSSEQPESSESESTSESQTTSESSEVNEQTSENNQ